MAKRPCFIVDEKKNFIIEKEIEFEYFNGFAVVQKQKSIRSLHKQISEVVKDKKTLEISTKSEDELGVRLSAFNLKYEHEGQLFNIENVFQSSKKFSEGGAFRDLLYVEPKTAKKDSRLRESGHLKCFIFENIIWGLEPKTAFYDYIYCKSLHRDIELRESIVEYDVFTDIEFNPKRSINCQARAAAIYVYLHRSGKLEESLKNKESFLKVYKDDDEEKTLF